MEFEVAVPGVFLLFRTDFAFRSRARIDASSFARQTLLLQKHKKERAEEVPAKDALIALSCIS